MIYRSDTIPKFFFPATMFCSKVSHVHVIDHCSFMLEQASVCSLIFGISHLVLQAVPHASRIL